MMKKVFLGFGFYCVFLILANKFVLADYEGINFDLENDYSRSNCNTAVAEPCVNYSLTDKNPYNTSLCSSGSFAICGVDPSSGGYVGASGVGQICSCLTPKRNDVWVPDKVELTENQSMCTCEWNSSSSFYYPTESNSCQGESVPYCHDSTVKNNGSLCTCGTAQEKYEFEKGISIYNDSPLKDEYASDVANNINDVNLHNASMSSTTHIYNPVCNGNGISTAFGCIPYSASGIATKLLQILFGVGGGIAFLLMVYGFILVATSSGDEKKLQAAKETITSAITGLLVSIFALFLFRLIAVNILKIPGL